MMTFRHWIVFGILALGVAACSFSGPAPNPDADIRYRQVIASKPQ
jgi:hypothetical protein